MSFLLKHIVKIKIIKTKMYSKGFTKKGFTIIKRSNSFILEYFLFFVFVFTKYVFSVKFQNTNHL